jgi:dnd system-associated protein 4
MVFAAAFGVKLKKRLPLGLIAQEPAPISLEIFISRSYDPLIKLLSTAEAEDTKILSAYNSEAEAQRVEILEEYANGGLETLQEQLKGATNYTERLLLILSSRRSPQPESEEEFDLGRFL